MQGGHIYQDVYQSWYSVQDEAFLTELQTEVRPDGTRGKDGYSICLEYIYSETFLLILTVLKRESILLFVVSLESGHQVEWAQEKNYVFKLNPFKERLEKWLTDNRVCC